MDIHDYFNSIDITILIPMLEEIFADDADFFHFLCHLLENENVISDNQIIQEQKGIMAGVPVSSFLANVYLMKLDYFFQEAGILYARYSDDIIIFADTEEELQQHITYIEHALARLHLTFNPDKVQITSPLEMWTFLGISYQNGVIDVSPVTIQKLKGKMKRKARALYRWKNKKNASDAQVIRAYLRHFNKKLFDNPLHNELTWCRWFFPLINTDKSLKELDHYMQSCVRYLTTGRYTKANYNLRYETMCELGYRSLVHEYYK